MVPRGHWLGLAFPVLLIALAASGACATEVSLVDQGWRIVEEAGTRQVELGALVVNEGQSALQHEVRFVVECTEPAPQIQVARQPDETVAQPVEPPWSVVQIKSVRGGPLAPDTSTVVTTAIPYELLKWGKAYRFRAELLTASSLEAIASTSITSLQSPFASPAMPAGWASMMPGGSTEHGASPTRSSPPVRPIGGETVGQHSAPPVGLPELPGSENLAESAQGLTRASALASLISGSGKMVGHHETHRVGGEWIEHGFGTITLVGIGWKMVLKYTYDAHGASAATLVASGTAEGRFNPKGGRTLPVRVTYGTAQITQPGQRSQWGDKIRRVGAMATGTFSGTVGGAPWSGVLSLTQGVMTLKLRSNEGDHWFFVQFTASG